MANPRAAMPSPIGSRSGPSRELGIYLAVLALALSPLLWVSVPPLTDFADHLAEAAILANRDPTAAMATNYVIDWRLIPNLAMEPIVAFLTQFLPLEVAGRIFIASIMILLAAGTACLHKAVFGRIGLWPLWSALFLYNGMLSGGIVNFLFALGVALLSFSLWIGSDAWPQRVRLAVFAVIAALIFVLHLLAFGLFGLLVASYEAGLALIERPRTLQNVLRRALALLQFVPTGVLWLATLSNMGELTTAWGAWQRKVQIWLAAPAFNHPQVPLDYAIIAATLAFIAFGVTTRRVVLAPTMRAPIAAVVITALLLPEWAFGGWGADTRLPAALLFIIVGATRLDKTHPRWPIAAFVLVGCLLFGLRITAVTLGWRAQDRQIAEFRAVIRTLPEGVRLMTVQSAWPREAHKLAGVPEALQIRPRSAYWHLDTLAVIDRGAFVSDLFTHDSLISVSPRNTGLDRTHWLPVRPEDLDDWASKPRVDRVTPAPIGGYVPCCYGWPYIFDFVFWVDFGHPPAQVPQYLEPWAAGSFFHIYRVTRP